MPINQINRSQQIGKSRREISSRTDRRPSAGAGTMAGRIIAPMSYLSRQRQIRSGIVSRPIRGRLNPRDTNAERQQQQHANDQSSTSHGAQVMDAKAMKAGSQKQKGCTTPLRSTSREARQPPADWGPRSVLPGRGRTPLISAHPASGRNPNCSRPTHRPRSSEQPRPAQTSGPCTQPNRCPRTASTCSE